MSEASISFPIVYLRLKCHVNVLIHTMLCELGDRVVRCAPLCLWVVAQYNATGRAGGLGQEVHRPSSFCNGQGT